MRVPIASNPAAVIEPNPRDPHALHVPPTAGSAQLAASPLVAYALDGLRRCWMPALQRYSHRFRFDVPESCNESVPASDAFYTLNVLLGLSQLSPHFRQNYLNQNSVYWECCKLLASGTARIYTLGMGLWAGTRLGLEPPDCIIDRVRRILTDLDAVEPLTAQDVGMLLSGVSAMAAADQGGWGGMADRLAQYLRQRYFNPDTDMFRNQSSGWRRNFSSFASQVYSILGLYHFGEMFQRDWAVALAGAAARRMIALQGPLGEWPWFYYVPQGRVVDFYEIYSVHQHGMAPAFLHHAVAHGVPGAREALIRGFLWLFATNEMGVSMLRPRERMFYRSQLRHGELASTRRRLRRSLLNAALGRSDTPSKHRRLMLRKECRSYELGWILWSFGDCNGYRELTGRTEFAASAA